MLVAAALRRRARRARAHRARRHRVARRCGATSRSSSTARRARARATSSASRAASSRSSRRKRAPRREPPRADAPPASAPTLYAVLGVTRTASDEEVRRAYKRQREIYATGGLATSSLLDRRQLRAAQARLDEAYDTLLDPVRRRAYDLSTFPEPSAPRRRRARAARARRRRAADAAGRARARDRPRHRVHRRAAPQGARVAGRRARRDQRAHEDRARATSRAIEDETYDAAARRGLRARLPRASSRSTCALDPAQVQTTYLRRMREELAARGKELA